MITHEPTAAQFPEQFACKLEIVQAGVDDFAERLRADVTKDSPHVGEAVESYIGLLERGGKRTRGMLTITGYEMCGGNDQAVARTAAGVVEAMHAYLLVVDDVADGADLRRNGQTAHVRMDKYLRESGMTGNTKKLGEDIAQTTAMFAQHKAQSELLLLDRVPVEQRVRASYLLNQGLALTGKGQLLDMVVAASDGVGIEDVLTVARCKTAYYSFLLPLQVGATLAGAPSEELEHFVAYSVNAGLAFQLQDDIISVFGDEAKTGKSRKSDIVEGKKTLLMTDALTHASEADFATLHAGLGNPELSDKHFEACLEIIKRTGALDRVGTMVTHYATQAQASLENVPDDWEPHHVQFLRDIAAYGAQRSH